MNNKLEINPVMTLFGRLLAIVLLLACPFLNAQDIDDAVIVTRVEATIDRTETLAGAAINVTSVNGFVLLTGQALSDEQKQAVSNAVAFATNNMRRLINELEVVSELDTSFIEADADLLRRIHEEIEFMALNTQVVVFNGVVHLMGQVSRDEADGAANAISRLDGVKTIRLSYEIIVNN